MVVARDAVFLQGVPDCWLKAAWPGSLLLTVARQLLTVARQLVSIINNVFFFNGCAPASRSVKCVQALVPYNYCALGRLFPVLEPAMNLFC